MWQNWRADDVTSRRFSRRIVHTRKTHAALLNSQSIHLVGFETVGARHVNQETLGLLKQSKSVGLKL